MGNTSPAGAGFKGAGSPDPLSRAWSAYNWDWAHSPGGRPLPFGPNDPAIVFPDLAWNYRAARAHLIVRTGTIATVLAGIKRKACAPAGPEGSDLA